MNLSTSAIRFADAQFILATVSEQAEAVVVIELKPKARSTVKNIFLKYVIFVFSSFIINKYLLVLRSLVNHLRFYHANYLWDFFLSNFMIFLE
tara:strand:+ start:744 stop:1022 length:279 start_codon:yes stop_codon:yes gene_type:complete